MLYRVCQRVMYVNSAIFFKFNYWSVFAIRFSHLATRLFEYFKTWRQKTCLVIFGMSFIAKCYDFQIDNFKLIGENCSLSVWSRMNTIDAIKTFIQTLWWPFHDVIRKIDNFTLPIGSYYRLAPFTYVTTLRFLNFWQWIELSQSYQK